MVAYILAEIQTGSVERYSSNILHSYTGTYGYYLESNMTYKHKST
jgi:hypothetical protein